MRAKTRLQHKVVTANEQLLSLTEKQELWAFRHCLNHYAFRTKSGMTTCMDCGHQWGETREKTCRCPHCDTKLEIEDVFAQIGIVLAEVRNRFWNWRWQEIMT